MLLTGTLGVVRRARRSFDPHPGIVHRVDRYAQTQREAILKLCLVMAKFDLIALRRILGFLEFDDQQVLIAPATMHNNIGIYQGVGI